MSAKISCFFDKKPAKKRKAVDDDTEAADAASSTDVSPVKKQKASSANKASSSSSAAVTDIASFAQMHTMMPESWMAQLGGEFKKPYWKALVAALVAEEKKRAKIFPPKPLIFRAFADCALDSLKVVIIGQDPYHDDGQAEGLCFSVPKTVKKLPPSLKNIYKELATDIDGFRVPKHGHLGKWATQGVLLLNTGLTVRAHEANSHKKFGWQKFTDAVVATIAAREQRVIFVCWGKHAQKVGQNIDRKKHHVINGVHPSPLSAFRGFFGSKVFSQVNTLLEADKRDPIDWQV